MSGPSSNVSTKPCGVDNNGTEINCDNSFECFATPTGPICSNTLAANYTWKLNPNVFPPIQYIGTNVGNKQKDRCELFTYTSWTDNNISWLLTFFYRNLDYNHSTTLPSGSFVKPLDNIGSCIEKFFCSDGNVCRKKINPSDSQNSNSNCTSSNQCASHLCGNQVTNLTDANLTDANLSIPGLLCVDDNLAAYNQLKGGRPFNVVPTLTDTDEGDYNGSGGRDYSGSMAVVIIIVVILFTAMGVYGYARRMFKKRDREDESRFLRREIDPETGQVITISGRVRRGASILLNGGSLNRSNSIRTLPPYTVVDEGQPSTSTSNGIVNSITQFFFPPGELPPPYDSVTENSDDNNNTMREVTHEVTLDEVRDGVTIEILNNVNINDNVNNNNNNNDNSNNDNNDNNDNNNNNNNNNSTPSSRRSSTSSKRDVDDSGELRELNAISEVSPDSSDSTMDKEKEEKEEKEVEEVKAEEKEVEEMEKEMEQKEEGGEKESTTKESTTEEESTTKEPKESITEESTTKEPTIEESITEESTTEESTTKEPAAEESITEESITEESTTKEPTPTTEESITEESTTKEPATEESIAKESTTTTTANESTSSKSTTINDPT